MMMNPVANTRPVLNPTVCVGITAFAIGTAIGIGMGYLIASNRYRNGFGGGIWFGRRRKRSTEIDDDDSFEIMNALDEAANKYDD